MVGPFEVAELDLRGRARRAEVELEAGLEELLPLVPVGDVGDLKARITRPQGQRLLDPGAPERTPHQHRGLERGRGDHGDGVRLGQVYVAVQVVPVHIPGVVDVGKVGVQPEQVSPAAGSEHLAVGAQVPDRGEQPGGVERHPDQTVVQ